MVYHVKIYFGSLLFVWAGIVQRSAKRSLAPSHRLCHRSTLRRPYSTNQSGSHLFHILLPHNTSILPQAISSACCPPPTGTLSTWWSPHQSAPSDNSHSTALRRADQYSGSRIHTLLIPLLNRPQTICQSPHKPHDLPVKSLDKNPAGRKWLL